MRHYQPLIDAIHDFESRGEQLSPEGRRQGLALATRLRDAVMKNSAHVLPAPKRPSEAREVLYRAGVRDPDMYSDNDLVEITSLCALRNRITELEYVEPAPDMFRTVQEFNKLVVGPEVDRTGMGVNTPPEAELLLGVRLLAEETSEMMEACGCYVLDRSPHEFHLDLEALNHEEALDAACDIVYVLFGLMLRLGIPADMFYAAFAEVTRANMAKAGGPTREDGKRLKPEGWTPPDIAGVIAAYNVQPIEEFIILDAEDDILY